MEGHSRTPRGPQKRREGHLVSGRCEQRACRGHPPRLRDHEAPSGRGWPAAPTPAAAWPGMTTAWPRPVGAPGGPATTQDPPGGGSQTGITTHLEQIGDDIAAGGTQAVLEHRGGQCGQRVGATAVKLQGWRAPAVSPGHVSRGLQRPQEPPWPGGWGLGAGAVPSWGRTKPRGPLLPTLPFSCAAPRLAWPT